LGREAGDLCGRGGWSLLLVLVLVRMLLGIRLRAWLLLGLLRRDESGLIFVGHGRRNEYADAVETVVELLGNATSNPIYLSLCQESTVGGNTLLITTRSFLMTQKPPCRISLPNHICKMNSA
jgi:hypothetical protein